MVRLLNDMLTLTSVEQHGKVELIERPDDIGTVLRWCVEHARFGLDTHSLQLYVDANLPRVSMDRDRIVQVVDNLISNAVKHTPPGSSIRVDAFREGGCIKVTVSDSGPGIGLDDQKKLFDCYFRASRQAPGHGIGLFVSRTLVEAHGGQLGVVSAPGFGSAFWFTLPS